MANNVLAGKLLAFSGPAAVSEVFYGYQTKIPEDYWPYFRHKQITAVIRLNRPVSFLSSTAMDCSIVCPWCLLGPFTWAANVHMPLSLDLNSFEHAALRNKAIYSWRLQAL